MILFYVPVFWQYSICKVEAIHFAFDFEKFVHSFKFHIDLNRQPMMLSGRNNLSFENWCVCVGEGIGDGGGWVSSGTLQICILLNA